MRLTRALSQQNIGWYFKEFWASKKFRKVYDTGAKKILAQKGIPVYQAEDFLFEKRPEFQKIDVVGYKPAPVALDKTHPNWHDRPLLTYKDHNVLLEGLDQAKILTNTVELRKGLPEFELKSTKNVDEIVKKNILATHVYDAEQKKLPKVKDPNRPAWNFPRTYGITQERINKLLVAKLLHVIENTTDFDIVKQRSIGNDLFFSYNFEKYDNLLQFQLRVDTLLTSIKPLSPISNELTNNLELPDIFPIKPTISLTPENIYEELNFYPINLNVVKSHPHTIFVHYINEEVRNLFEEKVTEPQIFGRSLLKSFTVAAAYAKQKYGDRNNVLPEPVTVQCVQTDGKLFHFGIFQLNTLNLDKESTKNVWYQSEMIPLFENCCYKNGKPILEGYNNKVLQHLYHFYKNS